ncbi:HD domain-containing protein [Candidatus Pacearchaeota archaeon]|nr:HD domain-containing protein [Candidatus Pacearchaeota archaeon]
MLNQDFFNELSKKIQPYFIKGGSHAFDHTERVYNLALKLSKNKEADLDIIKASALLHDISQLREHNKECECHAEDGAKLAEKILKEMNFPEEKIKQIVYSIKVHRHSKKIKAETKEAEILQDADRLDALGAITIARMFSSGGELNRPLHKPEVPFDNPKFNISTMHGFYSRILKITPETFNTKEAKEIAKERYKFVEVFLDRFLKEWKGEL